ncbi:hypothetical protein ACE1BS_25500, partial [Aeromonas jandaei]
AMQAEMSPVGSSCQYTLRSGLFTVEKVVIPCPLERFAKCASVQLDVGKHTTESARMQPCDVKSAGIHQEAAK